MVMPVSGAYLRPNFADAAAEAHRDDYNVARQAYIAAQRHPAVAKLAEPANAATTEAVMVLAAVTQPVAALPTEPETDGEDAIRIAASGYARARDLLG